MQSQLESDRLSVRTNLISTDRPDSSQLVDLHIYVIPKSVWKDRQNLAENEAMDQAISAGFVRVPQNLTIQELRQQIIDTCGQDNDFPKEFIYLRSVGRCLTKVRPQQETDLRVKNYRPPMTFAPEIYLLEGFHEEDQLLSTSKSYLVRESPIRQSITSPPRLLNSRQQSSIKENATPTPPPPLPPPLTKYPSSVHSGGRQNSFFNGPNVNSFSNFSTSSSTLTARDLAKLREEQERLRLRQIELARQRREIELQQQRRAKELQDKQKNLTEEQREKEEEAAARIQAAYRGYRHRRQFRKNEKQREISNFIEYRGLWSPEPEERRIRSSIKQRDIYSTPLERYRIWRNGHQWSASSSMKNENIYEKNSDIDQSFGFSSFRLAANEIERLQKEARELTRRKAEQEHAEEIQAHDVAKLSDHLEALRAKRMELEGSRETIVRRMQQLHAQISVRRKEERDLWKQKYLVEKKKTTVLEERIQAATKNEPDLTYQVEQAKLRYENNIKLRQQAENECRVLKQELQQIRLTLNALEQNSLSKQALPPPPSHPAPPPPQQQQQKPTVPLSLDITLQY